MSAERVRIPKHPGFYRRGDSVTFPYRDRQGRQHWGSAPTLAAAKRKKAALITDVERGEYRPRSRETFADYARAWVDSYQGRTSRRITAATRSDYRRRLEQEAIPFFGDRLLAEIEPQDIKAYAAKVAGRRRRKTRRGADGDPVVDERPISDNTVRLALAPVKALFATAFEEGVIRVNPAAGVRILTPRAIEELDEDEGPDRKALSESELEQLFAALPEAWTLFFDVLLALGLRISEMIELRWRDVDLGARKVRIRRRFYGGDVGPPKSRYGRRTLTLTPALARALWAMRKETRAGDDELVFTSAEGQRIIATNLMRRVLKKAARASGVGEWVGFHTFRHTCATSLFRAGWNPKQVQLWLGHHSASFTVDTYVHLLDEDLPEPPSLRGGNAGGNQTAPEAANSDAGEPMVHPQKQAVLPASASAAEGGAGNF